MVTMLLVIVVAAVTVGEYMFLVLSPSLLATGCLMPLMGFTLGYGLAAVLKLNES